MKAERNHARHHVGLILGLVGLVIGTALALASANVAASAEQADAGPISSAHAQKNPLSLNRWSSNGPEGGSVLSLAIDRSNPATIYAATGGGVFKSTNSGESWNQSNTGIRYQIYALAIDPTNSNIIYAGGSGVFKSTNGGSSWSQSSIGLGGVYALVIDPGTPTTLYAASDGVSKSTDGGVHWSTTNTGPFNKDPNGNGYVINLAIDPSNTNIIYASGGHRIIKSADGGASWSEIFDGSKVATFFTLAIDPINSNTIYAGGYAYDCCGGVVLKSTNNGGIWSQSFLSGSVSVLAIDPTNPNIIYAGGNGVFKSTNGGQSWSASNGGLTNLGGSALAIDPGNPSIVYIGGGGIFKSTSGAASWTAANKGLHAVNVWKIAVSPGSANTIFTETYSGVYKSADKGGSWAPSDFYPLAFDYRNPNIIYAIVSGHLSKSTDGGATWGSANTGLDNNDVRTLAIDPNNSEVIYAGTGGSLFKTINGGESWSAIGNLLCPELLAIDPGNSQTLYAVASYDCYDYCTTVYKSTDGGVNWIRSDSSASFYYVSALAIDPFNTQTIYVSDAGIAKSTDGGESWNALIRQPGTSGVSSVVVDPVHPNVIYAGTYGDGVFRSADGGATWNPLNDGLTNLNISVLAIDASGNFLHAGTPAGVFDYQNSAAGTPTPTPTPSSTPTPTPTSTPAATPTPTPTPNLVPAASWTLTGNLNTGRDSHTATRLQNGKVLVAGGNGSNGTLKSAEIYDPATGTWSNTGNLNTDRAFYTATLLSNGKVLVAGGFSCAPPPQICADVSGAELYDPATGTWTSTGNLNAARSGQTATLLSNGKVLVAGGFLANSALNTAELYDPVTGTWSSTGSLNTARSSNPAVLLQNGKVLVVAGDNSSKGGELYDPATGTWSVTGNLNTARTLHTATLLPSGKVLVASGFISFDTGQVTNSAELYDPATGLWSLTGNLNTGRALHTATLLTGGKVLVAGGYFVDNLPNITDKAELYDPATGTWSDTASLNNGRRRHTATLLLNGKVLASGNSFGGNTAELYDPGSEPVVLTADQVTLKSWPYQGRAYAYVKLSFPNSGYFVSDWGLPVRSGSDFSVNALVERSTGASVQAITTTAQIYDLGPLADGAYNFNFKTSGTFVKTLQFTVTSATPLPNPIDTAREFVKQQYRDFLNREADQAGEDFWTDNITKCSDPARRPAGQTEAQCTLRQRETTSGAFFLSPEFQYTGYFVYRIYQGALGRQPKLSEFISDAQFVGAGIIVNGQLSAAKINQNKADFARQFVNCTDATKYRCSEFKAIYDGLNNQQYVDKLFLTTGVNASTSDRTALVNGLNGGTETRASVLQKVVDGIVVISEGNQQFTTTYGQAFYNQESNRAFVQLQYFGYMKRDPDDAGYAFWLGKLNQFGGNFVNAEMVLAFISSPEYRARFGQP